MTQENKYLLLKLLQQHKELGISEQIDFDKFYLDSIISNSVSIITSYILLLTSYISLVYKTRECYIIHQRLFF